MQFALGYQQPDNGEPFPGIVADYRDAVAEVYFAWPGEPSGREASPGEADGGAAEAQAVLEDDLVALRGLGVRLDLLFNANCYGADATSEALAGRVARVIDRLGELCEGPDVVTTASPAIAHVLKTRHPRIETRASVNMRIGTTQAMEMVAPLFDGFYLQRDVQRDPARVRRAHAWCAAHGKRLCLLVNSGCLRYCPGQTFHDNVVAHEDEMRGRQNLPDFDPHVCWGLYRDPARLVAFLKSTWIRPEDLHRYEGLVDLCKLATRRHSHPRLVIGAYAGGRYRGDLLNLMEPCFAPALAPRYLDNEAFPADWADRTACCDGDCGDCDTCDRVLRRVLKVYGA